ncbi:hypothetical protein TVAG_430440 [Trichomonas vaginalis G3]|uniref:Bap-like n=1 Tax=Trichomonas vaginalis (strain ATCC PRA-98 / G3) TaxID=412133 RepID=A2E370_TRIV3|nr:hypothetical protein TVAG_430440 [Trichomonas vaginalis G3]|eukprot:XP_001325103.1 hypothetical protein [Trichomonas vaginalis G3]
MCTVERSATVHEICILTTDIESGPNEEMKYSTSIPNETDILVTIKPTIHAQLETKYISTKSSVTINGYVDCLSPATIRYWINDDEELTSEEITFNGLRYQFDNKKIQIPEKYKYGRHTFKIRVNSGNQESDVFPLEFDIKNKPKLSNITIGNEQYLLSSTDIDIAGVLDDQDKDKNLYFFIKFDDIDEITSLGRMKSNASQLNFKFTYTLPNIFGEKGLNIWCSTQENPSSKLSDLDKSEKVPKDILLTYKPILKLKEETDTIYQLDEIVPIKLTVKDDTNCTIKLTYNDKYLSDYDQEIASDDKETDVTINFTIPANSKPNDNSLKITLIDQYQKETINPIGKSFDIKNKPEISNFSISKNEVYYNDITYLSFLFTNRDENKKLYFYVKIDSNDPMLLFETISKGEKEKQMNLPLVAKAEYRRGLKNVIFWVQDSSDLKANLQKNSKSDDQKFDLTINYRPSIDVIFPTQRIYHENSSIELSGSIFAESNSQVRFRVDNSQFEDNSLNYEFNQFETNRNFSTFFKIPNTVKHGKHNLYVKVVDKENIESIESGFFFFMRNYPSLSNVTLSNSTAVPGHHNQR